MLTIFILVLSSIFEACDVNISLLFNAIIIISSYRKYFLVRFIFTTQVTILLVSLRLVIKKLFLVLIINNVSHHVLLLIIVISSVVSAFR